MIVKLIVRSHDKPFLGLRGNFAYLTPMHARAVQVTNGLTVQKNFYTDFPCAVTTPDFSSLTRQISSVTLLSFFKLCFILILQERTSNFIPIKCRTVVVMVVLAEEAMGVHTGVIRTGTVTFKATPPPVLETILQPIPTGMNILGLDLKSKFAGHLSIL